MNTSKSSLKNNVWEGIIIVFILKPSLQIQSTLLVMSHLLFWAGQNVLILQSSVSGLCAELIGMHALCCHNSVCLSGSLESKFLFSLSGSLDAMFEKSLNTSVNVTSPEIKWLQLTFWIACTYTCKVKKVMSTSGQWPIQLELILVSVGWSD